jgi:hypothetical protein
MLPMRGPRCGEYTKETPEQRMFTADSIEGLSCCCIDQSVTGLRVSTSLALSSYRRTRIGVVEVELVRIFQHAVMP